MRAWIFQPHTLKRQLGDKAPWSAGWYDPEGKRRSKRLGSKSRAETFARKVEGQLAAGTYQSVNRATWSEFEAEFESKVMAGMEPGTREATQYALNHFKKIAKPVRMAAITTKTFADYVAFRRLEPRTKHSKTLVSPATINKELRALRAMVRKAHKWGYLPKLPEFEFLKEPGKLAVYVTPEDFAKLYQACDQATAPEGLPYSPSDWWQALLVFAYMTGWRIGSILALRRDNLDLDGATALSLAKDNKGRRDQKIPLHSLVIDHLRKLASFDPLVFSSRVDRRRLYDGFFAIQDAAGVKPLGKARYGFHDLRRAFATMNAATLSADALQALMQHKDYQTTQRYINMARQLNPAVANLYVPTLKPVAVAG